MTLVRGGVSAASANNISLSVPFREDGGKLYIPVRVLNRSVWAMLDTGSDGNEMALSLAKSAAAQFPEAGSKELTLSGKVGAGDPKNKVTALVLGVPLPISLDTEQADAMPDGFRFGTASQVGASFLEEVIDRNHSLAASVKLGLPFFLQFRRVTIDYPNHVLILQQPQHGAALFAPVGAKGPSKAWPGYEWRRVGDGWVEAPDKDAQDKVAQGKEASASPLPAIVPAPATAPVPASVPAPATVILGAAAQTIIIGPTGTLTIMGPTGIKTVVTGSPGATLTLSSSDNGTITIIVNGVVIMCPAGSPIYVTSSTVTSLAQSRVTDPDVQAGH